PGQTNPRAWMLLLDDDAEQARIVATHARFTSAVGHDLETWLRLAAARGEFAAIAADRLAANPHDIATLYVEQLLAPAEQRAAICERHTALSRTNPTDGDYRFLADRCLPDFNERGAAFLKSYDFLPQSGWLAFAVGWEHALRARWQDALPPLELAYSRVPPLAETIAPILARLRRMTTAGPPDLTDLVRGSAGLRFFVSIEAGRPTLPQEQAYADLYSGRLVEAAAPGRSIEANDLARIVRLAAASDGAPPELVQRALRLPQDSVDPTTIFAVIGLLLRERDGTDGIAALARRTVPPMAAALMDIVDAVDARDFRRVDRLLEVADPAMRGQVYAMATVALGQATPRAWRDSAMRLLFVPERPYFAASSE
ncbi:MAG TPA: hypothetical protein VM692_13590, partial [Gammaproteobacteria bacterium]|nr:hypothetical protein [Gammaproteobacteria bacterium]